MSIKISLLQAMNINKSKKDFIFFEINKDGYIVNYKLTNDYLRNYKHWDNFRVMSCIKKELNKNLKFN